MLRGNFKKLFDIVRWAEYHRTPLMDVCRYDVENVLGTCRRHPTGLLNQKGHGVAFILQAQLKWKKRHWSIRKVVLHVFIIKCFALKKYDLDGSDKSSKNMDPLRCVSWFKLKGRAKIRKIITANKHYVQYRPHMNFSVNCITTPTHMPTSLIILP